MERDPELENLISEWAPLGSAADLNERMMSRYRAGRPSFWRRRWELHASIPAPAAVAVLLALLLSGVWLVSGRRPTTFRDRMDGFEPVAAPKLIVTRAEVSQ